MPDLVTMDQAKNHLRITSVQFDADISDKLAAATAIIIDYLTRRDATWNATMDAWTVDDVPKSIQAAVLVQLGELWRKRGDEVQIEQQEPGALSPVVMALLQRYRDPALA